MQHEPLAVNSFTTTIGNSDLTQAPNQPPQKIRRLIITQLDRGYYVEVGCQSMAIMNSTELINLLTQYILDPTATEEKYNTGTLFNNAQ